MLVLTDLHAPTLAGDGVPDLPERAARRNHKARTRRLPNGRRSRGPSVLGRALPDRRLFLERHRTRMAVARPGCQQQQQPCRSLSEDGVALTRRELDHQAASAGHALSAGRRDLDLPVDHRNPGPLVHLVIPKALPCGNLQYDRPSVAAAGEDLRRMGAKINRPQIPALHQPPLMLASRRPIIHSFSQIDSQK